MQFEPTSISGVTLITPPLFKDDRGGFMETYHTEKFRDGGVDYAFVQDNQSTSSQGTLRGLHYQTGEYAQAKLVRAVSGTVFDVAVDMRKDSPTFGKWTGHILSDENRAMLMLPPEFAHGFYVLSETATVAYKCSNLYHTASEQGILWSDSDIGIEWPLLNGEPPKLSKKDAIAQGFTGAPSF